MRYKHSLLLVDDMGRAKDFYGDLFGLKIVHDFGAHVTFEGGLAIHDREDYQSIAGNSAEAASCEQSAVYFESDDIISDYHALEQKKIRILHPIQLQSWNQQVFRCYDPDGHLIEVGESMEQVILRLHAGGKHRDDIIRMTRLPQDLVDLVLDRRYGDRQSLKS